MSLCLSYIYRMLQDLGSNRPIRFCVLGKSDYELEVMLLRHLPHVVLFVKHTPEMQRLGLSLGHGNIKWRHDGHTCFDVVYVCNDADLVAHAKLAFLYATKYVFVQNFVSRGVKTARPRIEVSLDLGVFPIKQSLATIHEHEKDHETETLAVVTPTYQRASNKTREYLRVTYANLLGQTDKNWCWFIVGDEYGKNFESDLEFIDDSRVFKMDLLCAGERNYFAGQWCNLGCYAYNTAVKWALQKGYRFVVNMDDDDEWLPDHLSCIRKGFLRGANFVCTRAQHVTNQLLPSVDSLSIHSILPKMGQMVNSSFAFDAKALEWLKDPSFSFQAWPCDGQQLEAFAAQTNLYALCVPMCTVLHVRENNNETVHRSVRLWLMPTEAPDGWTKDTKENETPWVVRADVPSMYSVWHVVSPTCNMEAWNGWVKMDQDIFAEDVYKKL